MPTPEVAPDDAVAAALLRALEVLQRWAGVALAREVRGEEFLTPSAEVGSVVQSQ